MSRNRRQLPPCKTYNLNLYLKRHRVECRDDCQCRCMMFKLRENNDTPLSNHRTQVSSAFVTRFSCYNVFQAETWLNSCLLILFLTKKIDTSLIKIKILHIHNDRILITNANRKENNCFTIVPSKYLTRQFFMLFYF